MIRHQSGCWYKDKRLLEHCRHRWTDNLESFVRAADAEGWCLRGSPPLLVAIRAPLDEGAWAHVGDRAAQGSPLHLAALAELRRLNRTEFNCIREYYLDLLEERRQLNETELRHA